jgi:hypothetical protein
MSRALRAAATLVMFATITIVEVGKRWMPG